MEEKNIDQYEQSRQKIEDLSKYIPNSKTQEEEPSEPEATSIEEEIDEEIKEGQKEQEQVTQNFAERARKTAKSAGLFLGNLFTFGRLTYDPAAHAKELEQRAIKKGEVPFAELNKERLARENGQFKTNLEISLESVFGKEFTELIKTDSEKSQVYNQIIRQMRKMEDPSKIDISLFKPEYDKNKVNLIFKAQKNGYDASIYKHLTAKACEVILNAQNNNLKPSEIDELLNLPDEQMEEKLNKILKENGVISSRQYIHDGNDYIENIVNTTLDEEIAKYSTPSQEEIQKQNITTELNSEKNTVGLEM